MLYSCTHMATVGVKVLIIDDYLHTYGEIINYTGIIYHIYHKLKLKIQLIRKSTLYCIV